MLEEQCYTIPFPEAHFDLWKQVSGPNVLINEVCIAAILIYCYTYITYLINHANQLCYISLC